MRSMLQALAAEFAEHLAAGREDAAANCQREALAVTGPCACPLWAAPAIAETSVTDAEREAIEGALRQIEELVELNRNPNATRTTEFDEALRFSLFAASARAEAIR